MFIDGTGEAEATGDLATWYGILSNSACFATP